MRELLIALAVMLSIVALVVIWPYTLIGLTGFVIGLVCGEMIFN